MKLILGKIKKKNNSMIGFLERSKKRKTTWRRSCQLIASTYVEL